MKRAQTYQVPKGKTKNGFTKKESQPLATAPRPLPEGELIISFYDSTKALLSTEILSLKSENEWETLAFSAKADEKGFVSASIRGTSSEPVKFDDFSIQLKSLYSAKLYQENHYYPFGMNMKGLESSDKQSTQNKKEHEFQFNAQTEREESFGLFWDETPFRPMDMQLGRFWGVDRLIEGYASLTPFHYSVNNPISYNDPTGLFPDLPTGGGLSGFDPFKSNDDRMRDFTNSMSPRSDGFLGRGRGSSSGSGYSKEIFGFQGVAHTIDESSLEDISSITYEFGNTAYLDNGRWVLSHRILEGITIELVGGGKRVLGYGHNMLKRSTIAKALFFSATKAYFSFDNMYNEIALAAHRGAAGTAGGRHLSYIAKYEAKIAKNASRLKLLRNGWLGARNFYILGTALSVYEGSQILSHASAHGGHTNAHYWKYAGVAADIAIGGAALMASGPAAPFIVVGAFVYFAGRAVYRSSIEKSLPE